MRSRYDTVELASGVSVPAVAWHRPPWSYDQTGGLLAYQPGIPDEGSGAARAIRRAFRASAVADQGIVWLAPQWPDAEWCWKVWSDHERSVQVDLRLLDVKRMRFTYGSEGYVWHLGNIDSAAIVEPELLIARAS